MDWQDVKKVAETVTDHLSTLPRTGKASAGGLKRDMDQKEKVHRREQLEGKQGWFI